VSTESLGKPVRHAISWLPGGPQLQGGMGVAFGASIWGLFWIPLRYLDSLNIHGFWAIALVMTGVFLLALCVLVKLNRLAALLHRNVWFVGMALGLSIVLYFIGVIFSDVIRVLFLFYLMPVWTTIASRVLYKEPITPVNFLVIAMALAGLWLLLGGGTNIPLPKNAGDWCGLLAGICWGVSLALLRGIDDMDATATTCTTGLSSAMVAILMAFLLSTLAPQALVQLPNPASWAYAIVVALGFSLVLLYPSLLFQIWGAQRIAAPTAALLTMPEILVATISAYLLIGTELNRVSMVGALVILIAVLIDVGVKYKKTQSSIQQIT